LRVHGTTLHNSIYRLDRQMLVNCHSYGVSAFQLINSVLPAGRP
jgi:hypothetical protein